MDNKSIAVIRHYHGYTGGHQKVHDYLTHFIAMGWHPSLFLSNRAKTNKTLFENMAGVDYQDSFNPNDADVVFLAGMDWQHYLPIKSSEKPVINLIQHVRHADKSEALFAFLKEPAIRLCVSDAVKQAIEPFANGPCHVIKMGHKFERLSVGRSNDVYILANKQPQLGISIYNWAKDRGFSTILHDSTQEKGLVTKAMAMSAVTVALPNKTEGFYLPGIEAMFYSKQAVVPYCIANKEYFHNTSNLIMPDYTEDNIKSAILRSMRLGPIESSIRKFIGKKIACQYSLQNERKALSACLSKYF